MLNRNPETYNEIVHLKRMLSLAQNYQVSNEVIDEISDFKWNKVLYSFVDFEEREKAFEIVTDLRRAGKTADFDHMGRSIKAQFKYADKIGAKKVAVIGSNELINNSVKVKDMTTGQEQMVSFDELVK